MYFKPNIDLSEEQQGSKQKWEVIGVYISIVWLNLIHPPPCEGIQNLGAESIPFPRVLKKDQLT